jgi:hypothetical protein
MSAASFRVHGKPTGSPQRKQTHAKGSCRDVACYVSEPASCMDADGARPHSQLFSKLSSRAKGGSPKSRDIAFDSKSCVAAKRLLPSLACLSEAASHYRTRLQAGDNVHKKLGFSPPACRAFSARRDLLADPALTGWASHLSRRWRSYSQGEHRCISAEGAEHA